MEYSDIYKQNNVFKSIFGSDSDKVPYGKTDGRIYIWQDPYNEGFNTTNRKWLKFNPGLTILTGCNGIGKTTLINNIKSVLKEKNIAFMHYNNKTDGTSYVTQRLIGHSNMLPLLSEIAFSSEGEQLRHCCGLFGAAIGSNIQSEFASADEIWLLFDGLDSGLSIDCVDEVKHDLFDMILADNADKDIYIIVSANSYEMAREERCLDVYSGEIRSFSDYEAYRDYIFKCREWKESRYE